MVEISCNHSISNAYDFFWYLHSPGCAPRLLVKGSRPSQKGRYNMTYERFSSSLLILQVQVADAATYYCALGDTEAENPRRAEQKQGESTAFAGGRQESSNNCFLPNLVFPKLFYLALLLKCILSSDTLYIIKLSVQWRQGEKNPQGRKISFTLKSRSLFIYRDSPLYCTL